MTHAELIKENSPYITEIITSRHQGEWHTYVARDNEGNVNVIEIGNDGCYGVMMAPIDDREQITICLRLGYAIRDPKEVLGECDRLGWHAPSE